MSDDDALCKPLTIIYNELLSKWQKKPYRDNEYVGSVPPTTDFDVTDPKVFSQIGLESPKPVAVRYDRKFYRLDIRNNNDVRLVSVHDIYRDIDTGLMDRSTWIDIFKRGYNLTNIDMPKDPKEFWEPDPKFLESNADYRFLWTTQENEINSQRVPLYYLKKWPKFSYIWKLYLNRSVDLLPVISDFGTFRIFLYKKSTIVIIYDEFSEWPLRKDQNSYVVLYKIENKNIHDLCYISLNPQDFSRRRQ